MEAKVFAVLLIHNSADYIWLSFSSRLLNIHVYHRTCTFWV